MSRFFSKKYGDLTPYTPGEQPRDMRYIKLNTNESPFPPSPKAQAYAKKAAEDLQLYSDPACTQLAIAAAEYYGIGQDQILFTNGSDDALNFAFMAFCDDGAVFPDITYGFYEVFAGLNGVAWEKIPLKADYSICVEDYIGVNRTVFIANPNAPTGIALPLSDIERILQGNPDHVVVIDEAYVDFGAESAWKLIDRYENLLVVQTFSKSRSLAGGRLGFAMGSRALIRDLNTIRFSTNPYNINRMTMAAGVGALEDVAYFRNNCAAIEANRAWTVEALEALGFSVLPSKANFVFATHPKLDGGWLYRTLKARGVLVRHFDKPRLSQHIRITIGSRQQMEALVQTVKKIMEDTL